MTPPLAPELLAAYANDIVRAFGAGASFDVPGDFRGHAKIRERVCEVLAEIRPHPDGPSLAEALVDLLADARRGWLDRGGAARRLAELSALFDQAAFRRTKRAERGRLFAELVVLFQLEPATGLESAAEKASVDAEDHLRLVRRRLNRKSGGKRT